MLWGIKQRCWLEWSVIGFGLPAVNSILSKVVVAIVPAATHGTPPQRFLLSLAGAIAGEWLFVSAVWIALKSRGRSLGDIGTWRAGNWMAWLLAVGLAGISTASNLRFLPRMHIPILSAFLPTGFHLVASLALGITAGFCEEVLFRGFLMDEFAEAGYGRAAQIILPGIAFAFAHLGYSSYGFLAAVGIIVPTALLGMLWGAAYLLGRRALLPCIVAHFINDSTAGPWIAWFMFTGRLGGA